MTTETALEITSALEGSPFELREARATRTARVDAAALASGEIGFLHSYTTGSAVDGPGMRVTLWTTGCLFRCTYCHNPDTWHRGNGLPVRADELVERVAAYRRFLAVTGGGVTISGGEPLVQSQFVCRVLRACKRLGIHTALDTNGFLGDRLSDADLEQIDLVLLDLKAGSPARHLEVTGQPLGPVLAFARRLAALGRPAWVRYVLVPGQTDDPAEIGAVAEVVAGLPNVARVEVLPFHQMGAFKWERLGLRYPLRDCPPATPEQVARAVAIFRGRGVEAV